MKICITSDEFEPIHTTLAALFADDDGARENRDEIEAALESGGTYTEGGGACPQFTITAAA